MSHRGVIQEIRDRLRSINIANWSGGKDSTTMLQLIMAAIKGTGKKLYITNADTLMELPFYEQFSRRIGGFIGDFLASGRGYRWNASMITLFPRPEKTFWVGMLGKGFPAPHDGGFRWCTGALKIDPIEEFLKSIRETYGSDYMVFVGVRKDESTQRAERYPVKDYAPNHFAPLLDWSTQDVWTYLLTEPCPWGGDHAELVNVYKYASDECLYGATQGVCVGNARYGCWICPLQSNSQLKLLASNLHDPRYLLLRQYKDIYVAMSSNWSNRSRIRRNGKADEGPGPFLVSVRKELYTALKKLESDTGWQLIRPDEEQLIFEFWRKEADIHCYPNTDRPTLF